MDRPHVLILDFGSQYTMLIARRIREQSVYCEIQPCTLSLAEIRRRAPRAVILSGGPSSVFDAGAPGVDPGVYELGVPVLGICYGEQITAHTLGGLVERADHREYGPAKVTIDKPVGVLARFAAGEVIDVWMSHGDRVVSLPEGFEVLGTSRSSPFAAVGNLAKRIYGVQFHPEVVHTPRGGDILSAFLFEVAGLHPDWNPGVFIDEAVQRIRDALPEGRVICGLSGGVDSSVAAVLTQRAVGDRLTCIFVDNGLLRKNEAQEVVRMFREQVAVGEHGEGRLNLVHVDASERFLSALAGVSDPEQKRKIIGRVFIEVFDAEAAKVRGATHLVQDIRSHKHNRARQANRTSKLCDWTQAYKG